MVSYCIWEYYPNDDDTKHFNKMNKQQINITLCFFFFRLIHKIWMTTWLYYYSKKFNFSLNLGVALWQTWKWIKNVQLRKCQNWAYYTMIRLQQLFYSRLLLEFRCFSSMTCLVTNVILNQNRFKSTSWIILHSGI